MSSRQIEIEAKKARIAELKRLREEKRLRSAPSSSNLSESKPASNTSSKDIDDLVNSLVGPTTTSRSTGASGRSSTPSNTTPTTATTATTPRNTSALSNRDILSPSTSVSLSPSTGSLRTQVPIQPDFGSPLPHNDIFSSSSEVGASVAQQSFTRPGSVLQGRPRDNVITYSKEVQTSDSWFQQETQTDDRLTKTPRLEEIERLRASIRAEFEEEYQKKLESTDLVVQPAAKEPEYEIEIFEIEKESNDDDSMKYIEKEQAEEELAQFLDQSLKVVSRALDYDYDITTDYSTSSNLNSSSIFGGKDGLSGDKSLTEIAKFFSPEHSAGRTVTDLDWSPFHAELLASAHTEQRTRSVSSTSPKGIVQIWNMHARSRPEYIFTARSDILAVRFSPFDPSMLLGTAYNGQVMAWDMRTPPRASPNITFVSRQSKGPSRGYRDAVLTSPLNGSGHSHPAYAMALTGTRHAHTLLTASTDGTVCTWAPDMLEVPQDRLTLSATFSGISPSPSSGLTGLMGSHGLLSTMSSSRSDDVAPTRLAVSPRDSSRFVVGTEEGAIYACARFGQAGARAGIVGANDSRSPPGTGSGFGGSSSGAASSIGGVYRGHRAPVTSLDFHSPRGPSDFSDLLLSSSLDWSLKLWRVRASSLSSLSHPTPTSPTSSSYGLGSPSGSNTNGGSGGVAPLLDIPREYELYDVAWSPAHPSVFAAVDGSGHLEVWDLNRDTEAPTARVRPGAYVPPNQAGKPSDRLPRTRGPVSPEKGAQQDSFAHTTEANEYLSRPLNRVAWDKVSPSSLPDTSGNSSSGNEKAESSGADGVESGAPQSNGGSNSTWGSGGRRIAVGGLDGVVSVFEVDAEMYCTPKPSDWIRMERLVSQLEEDSLGDF